MGINNVILDFGIDTASINALTTRLKNKKQSYEVIRVSPEFLKGNPTLKEIGLFKKIDSNTRIYLFAHGGLSRPEKLIGHDLPDDLVQKKEVEFHYEDVSNFLVKRLNKDLFEDKDKHLKISIIACHAGLKQPEKEYFAFHLHRDLAKQGLITEIYARNSRTSIVKSADEHIGKKIVRSLDDSNIDESVRLVEEHFEKWVESGVKKPGTKIKLTWTPEGDQLVKDAYVDNFYQLSREACKEMKSKLSTPNFKNMENKKEIITKIDNVLSTINTNESTDLSDIRKIYSTLENIETTLNAQSEFSSPSLKKSLVIVDRFINTLNKEEMLIKFKGLAMELYEDVLDALPEQHKAEVKKSLKVIADHCNPNSQPNELTMKKIIKELRDVKLDHFKNNKVISNKLAQLCKIGKICISKREIIKTETTGHKIKREKFTIEKFTEEAKTICEDMLDVLTDKTIENKPIIKNEIKEIYKKLTAIPLEMTEEEAKQITSKLKELKTIFQKTDSNIPERIEKWIKLAHA